jgi:hypothetical protein
MSQRLEEKRGARRAEPLGSSPDYRWNAVPSADRVSVVSEGAFWEGPSGGGRSSTAAADRAARLAVTVQVRQVQLGTRVWVDVYAFDTDGGLVSFDTHDLQHAEPAAPETGGGELFVLDAPVWEPASAPSGIAAPAPKRLKYRVYVRPEAGLFTDGLLHDLSLPERKGVRTRRRVPQMEPKSRGQG